MTNNSTTDKPWKEPGQTSQDRSQQPTPNVVEQEKNKKRPRSDLRDEAFGTYDSLNDKPKGLRRMGGRPNKGSYRGH
jgi:hypothetical protein